MVSKEEAISVLEEKLSRYQLPDGDTVIICQVIDKPYGWIFFYQSRFCIEKINFHHCLAGNGPIAIESIDGAMTHLPSGDPAEVSISRYEERRLLKYPATV